MSSPSAELSAEDGRSTRWNSHRASRRQAIVDAAIAAIEEHGPDALTGQIAAKAGLARTHVYRHFADKQALDLAVAQQLVEGLTSRIRGALVNPGSPMSIIRAAVSEHLAWVDEHPNLYRFLVRRSHTDAETGSDLATDVKDAFARELTALLGAYFELFDVPASDAEPVVVGLVGMVDSTATWWAERRTIDRGELCETLVRRCWMMIDDAARQFGVTVSPEDPLPGLT